MTIGQLAIEYDKALGRASELGRELARRLAEVLSGVIPDIKYSLGWYDTGPEVIYFESESHSKESMDVDRLVDELAGGRMFSLQEILEEVFRFENAYFECAIYLTPEEADEVRIAIQRATG